MSVTFVDFQVGNDHTYTRQSLLEFLIHTLQCFINKKLFGATQKQQVAKILHWEFH